MLAPAVLTVLGAAIGTTRLISPKRDFQAFPIIWSVSIDESGNRKSPATKQVYAPLVALQEKADQKYKRQKRQYEARRRAWESAPHGGRGPAPLEPDYGHIIADDVTVEGMGKLLSQSPRGIALLKDELSDFINNLGQYKKQSNDGAKYLQFFDATAFKIDRKTQDPIFVKRPAVWISGTIQPPVFWKCFPDLQISNGFLARFQLSYPQEFVPRLSDDEVSEEASREWKTLVERLHSLRFQPPNSKAATAAGGDGDGCQQVDGNTECEDEFAECTEPVNVGLTPEAHELFRVFYDRNGEEAAAEKDIATRVSWKKMSGYALKYALIDYLVRQVSQPDYLATSTTTDPQAPAARELVGADSMQRAIEIADWFRHEARRIFRMRTDMTSTTDSDEQSLLEFVGKRGQVTARQVADNFRRFNKQSRMVEESLDELVVKKLIRAFQKRSATGGRPTTYYSRR